MTTPTGVHHELRLGDQTAVVVEAGGGLRTYVIADRPVLDGFAAGDRIDGGRGQLLAPWPNRIGDGRYRWADQDLQLPLTEVAARNAIHGLLRWVSWALVDRDEARVVLTATVWPQPGYPFTIVVHTTYELTDVGLSITVTARNNGAAAAPYGVGQHPYLTVGTELVDDAVLLLPASRWVRSDDRGLPVGTEPVEGTGYDFRTPRPIGAQVLDTAYAGLARDDSGRAVVRLAHPSEGHGVDLWLGEGAEHLQVFTGDTLHSSRRRHGLAVEPMSCPPDAFNSGVGLVALEPGAAHTMRWGLAPW